MKLIVLVNIIQNPYLLYFTNYLLKILYKKILKSEQKESLNLMNRF